MAATSFSAAQYEFLVRLTAEGAGSDEIIVKFARQWRDIRLDPQDLAAFQRDRLSPDWQRVYDVAATEYEQRTLAKQENRLRAFARRLELAIECGQDDKALKIGELLEKMQAGFYRSKAVAVTNESGGGISEVTEIKRTIIDAGRPDA